MYITFYLECIFPSVAGTNLSTHPAKKFVMDFLRMVIVDSLSLPQTGKSAPVIDLILEVRGPGNTYLSV